MFLFGKKQIEIKEIERKTVSSSDGKHMKSVKVNSYNSLSFSSTRLHIAIARSILSTDLTNIDLLFEAHSSFLRYQTIINTFEKNLTLNKDSYEALRDFSQTGRTGELAQGLTYLLAQDHLCYPIVVDFEGYIKSKCPNIKKMGETPDYILQKKLNTDVSLIESKGAYASKNSSTKGKLKKALDQCENGVKIIENNLSGYSVIKTYGVCAKLFNEKDSKVSELQFVDPDFKGRNGEDNIDLVRYHYASWFLLMGNIPIYDKLMNGEFISRDDYETGQEKNIYGKPFMMFPFRYSINFLFPLNIYNYFDTYGIRVEVLKALEGSPKIFSEIQFQLDRNVSENKSESEYFNDGTIIDGIQRR